MIKGFSELISEKNQRAEKGGEWEEGLIRK